MLCGAHKGVKQGRGVQVVVVSRWYGGILLGPDRFKHINNAARTLLDACGYIAKNTEKKQKGSTSTGSTKGNKK